MGATEPTGGDRKYIRVITKNQSANFILGKFGPCNVAIISTGQGPDETDRVLTSVQNDVNAEFVIAIGICYGAKESETEELGDKTKLADIIVAKSIINTTSKRNERTETVVKTKECQCGGKLLNLFRHDDVFKFKSKPVKVHIGVLASEDTLQHNEEEKQKMLKQVPQVLGGEMEANGINRVAEREGGFQWIVIKAIVDWGNEKKDKKWQKFAAVSCARFVRQCLKDNEQPDGGDPLKEL
ncbi:PREDICTED: uncharacterized protein LOC109592370 [Amphimedon queenslandica]|uniref:Nucleoside phosphorylase domain-containing protein n=1 Tax=Amphimedon queenslandica TaxID=400682 RepID=A0AAN0K289_AMPQE|nr:PREDICTED: uncharacterized protein LOC109592370 [Amphimedon queenslandica]|eukprot:XP_019863391.1 PREDICTED: uncharacterized protein LOC109592370 [Amphimedon queenslandica]